MKATSASRAKGRTCSEDAERTRLRCDWCELMGATGPRTLELLEREGVLAAGGFVGVDLDAARIEAFRTQQPDLKWVTANLHERLDAPEFDKVVLGSAWVANTEGVDVKCR